MQKLHKLPATSKIVCIGRTRIYDLVKKGRFPQPVRLGARSVAWREDELLKWIDDLPRGTADSSVLSIE